MLEHVSLARLIARKISWRRFPLCSVAQSAIACDANKPLCCCTTVATAFLRSTETESRNTMDKLELHASNYEVSMPSANNSAPRKPFSLDWLNQKKQSSLRGARVISSNERFTDSRGTEYFRLPSGQIRRMTAKV